MVSDTLSDNGVEYLKLGASQKIKGCVISREHNLVLRLIGLLLEFL